MRLVRACCAAAILLTFGCGGIASDQGGAAQGGAGAQNVNGAGSSGTGTAGGASGTGGSSPGGAAGIDVVEPESCTQFGIEFSRDCSECPGAPLSCACFTGLQTFPQVACTFGNCIVALDCDRVCRNAGDSSNPHPGGKFNPDFNADWAAIQDCVDALMRCDSGDDDDCGEGKCVFDPVAGTGRCSTGDEHQGCKEPNDCQSGFCVGFNSGSSGRCALGYPGAGCETSDQCLAGTCQLYTPGPDDSASEGPGFCSSGLPDEPCTADEQCRAPTHCVPAFSTRVLGSCSPGAIDDLCNDDGDCQSGFCFYWDNGDDTVAHESGRCTAGGFRDGCVDGSDCESGYCSRPIGNGGGSCVPGDALSPCFSDEDCASAHCALLVVSDDPLSPYPVAEGLCTSRASGAPCQDNAECTSASCVNPSRVPSAACPSTPNAAGGTPCENGGVCNNTERCFQGKCE